MRGSDCRSGGTTTTCGPTRHWAGSRPPRTNHIYQQDSPHERGSQGAQVSSARQVVKKITLCGSKERAPLQSETDGVADHLLTK
jgi:hypothetical protein